MTSSENSPVRVTPKKELDPRAIDVLLNSTKEARLYLCSIDPKYFAIYYFSEYFDYRLAPFHLDFYDDARALVEGEIDEAAWIAYRESAKTSIAKIAYITWAICFKKKRYINVDSYDKANAESTLYDVALNLQTNQKIIADFGHLFYRKVKVEKGDEEDQGSTKKGLGAFVTENGVKCEAFSTGTSTRGRLFRKFRPDLFLIDDVENNITKDSAAIRSKIIAHIDELKAGLSGGACVLYLGNFIVEDGVIAYVMEAIKRNPQRARLRFLPVEDPGTGKVSWPDKYTKTDAEAIEANKSISDPRKQKISLEAKRRQLGDPAYEADMMNNPGKTGDYFFNRVKIRLALNNACEPERNRGNFKVWFEYNPMHAYAVGGDTSEGISLDANASVVIGFKHKDKAGKSYVAATFADNKIAPNVFGHEMAIQGNEYGTALLAPEINNTGYATIAELITLEYPNLYQREVKNKKTNQAANEYGFKTTMGNKWEILGNLKSAFEDDQLLILDKDLLMEMYYFTKTHARLTSNEKGATRHFDKLMAAAIAWEMRHHVAVPQAHPDRAKLFKAIKRESSPLY